MSYSYTGGSRHGWTMQLSSTPPQDGPYRLVIAPFCYILDPLVMMWSLSSMICSL